MTLKACSDLRGWLTHALAMAELMVGQGGVETLEMKESLEYLHISIARSRLSRMDLKETLVHPFILIIENPFFFFFSFPCFDGSKLAMDCMDIVAKRANSANDSRNPPSNSKAWRDRRWLRREGVSPKFLWICQPTPMLYRTLSWLMGETASDLDPGLLPSRATSHCLENLVPMDSGVRPALGKMVLAWALSILLSSSLSHTPCSWSLLH